MTSSRSFSVLTLLFCAALFAVSCGSGAGESAGHSHDEPHEHADHDHADHDHDHETSASTNPVGAHGEGKEYTSAYVCPMHCKGSGSEEAGKCPVCGMSYVAQADHVKDGHSH